MKKIWTWLLASLLLVSCNAKKAEHLNLYVWSYYIPDYILAAFKSETGIDVNYDTYDSNEKMYAKLATGNSHFDLVVPSGDFVSIMIQQDMLSPIDHVQIPNLSKITPKIEEYATFDPQHGYSVPYFIGASGINVNKEFVKDAPESWSIFSDTRYKNRMSMLHDMREVFGAALKFLGYSVNSRDEKELSMAKDLIIKWKMNLLKFDSETFGKDFASHNAYIVQGYSEVVLKELEARQLQNYDFILPKEGGPMYMDSFVILKNAKNKDNAHALINYILSPENYARIADEYFYPSLIPEADALRQKQPYYTVDELMNKNFEFKNDLGESVKVYSKLWDEILQS